jgi:type II secretion system protein H
MTNHEQSGFTLLELLIVLMLLAAANGAASLVLFEISSSKKLESASREISQTLETLVLRAAETRQSHRIVFDRSGYQFGRDGDSLTARSLPAQLSIAINSSAPDEIRVSGNGIVSPATIDLHLGDGHCSVTVGLRGKVRQVC